MTIKPIAAFALIATISACAAAPKATGPRPQAIAPPPAMATVTGLDRVIGKDARALVSLFGAADQDVSEANARRLQFAGTACILDAYLYPPSNGREPVVTYVDARTNDGRPAERASCVSALAKER
jgi:hypothetical protein